MRSTRVDLVVSHGVQLFEYSYSVVIMDPLTSNVIYVDKRAVRDRYVTSAGYLTLDVPKLVAEYPDSFEVEDQEFQFNIATLLSVFSKGRF